MTKICKQNFNYSAPEQSHDSGLRNVYFQNMTKSFSIDTFIFNLCRTNDMIDTSIMHTYVIEGDIDIGVQNKV